MKTRAFCAALVVGLALFAIAPSAKSQQALVVDTCGTLPANLRTGQAKQIYQDKTGKQCVAASVSASITPFTPGTSGARGTPLTVTTSDSSGSLPTNGGAVAVSNVGTNPMYCNVNGVAATVADQLITANGGWFNFGIPAGVTTLHCIATGGSTTANSVGGSGLATGTGGGSGGGGGGTVTQGPTGTNAAAWWAQIGDTARGPAKVQAGNSAATTDVALTVADPNVLAAVQGPVAAGTNYIGQIGSWAAPTSYLSGTTAAMTGTTSTQLLAAVASKKLYVMSISCVNSHATQGTFVTVQDGSGGTALATLAAAAVYGGDEKTSVGPLFSTTSGNGLFVADVTTGANVICNASGFAQ